MGTAQLNNSGVPDSRIRVLGDGSVQAQGDYVLYWMINARRTKWNFGLQRAVEWASELGKPLVVFEPLRSSYRWNSDRLHAFVIQGMIDNADELADKNVLYYPYIEPSPGDEKGLLQSLAEQACVVVSDDFPCIFLPEMTQKAARLIDVPLELIDSNGMYPMRDTDRVFNRAYDFRRHLQKQLLPHLNDVPKEHPFQGYRLESLDQLPQSVTKRWPMADLETFSEGFSELSKIPLNHDVGMVETRGGMEAANERLNLFLSAKLDSYDDSRNEPEKMMTSGLSPYLHFGHVSAHQVFARIAERTGWSENDVADEAKGKSRGWWGLDESVESFLDELITWREVGYNMCANSDNYDQYESLPEWARKTLAEHEDDQREYLYSDEEFELAQTHDELWNAAQRQLTTTGVMHNYLRMLWGKKILEWTKTPQDALRVMTELNNKWAIDGRNPNSYSGIFWVLGRYDRAWGERPIFGKIRYMSSENTAKKVKVGNYIEKFAESSD